MPASSTPLPHRFHHHRPPLLPFQPPKCLRCNPAWVQMQEVAEATGIVLDPVYSGKAIHGLLSEIRASPDAWRGRK